MKLNKKVLALALAALVATGTSSMFASNDDSDTTKTEQCKNKKDCKKDGKDCKKKDCKKGDRKDGRKDGRHGRCDGKRADLFQGVELTAEQQAALKQYREKKESARRDEMKKDREDFMNELKSVLTPEQYQQVEKNAAHIRAEKPAKGNRGSRR